MAKVKIWPWVTQSLLLVHTCHSKLCIDSTPALMVMHLHLECTVSDLRLVKGLE